MQFYFFSIFGFYVIIPNLYITFLLRLLFSTYSILFTQFTVPYTLYYYFSPETLKNLVGVQQDSVASWGESASLALVGHCSSDGVTIKIPYGIDDLLH